MGCPLGERVERPTPGPAFTGGPTGTGKDAVSGSNTARGCDLRMSSTVPFSRVAQHLVAIPTTASGGLRSRFLLDTGIGVNLVFQAFAGRMGVIPTGETFTGRRMSGQPIPLGMGRLPSLRVGDLEVRDVPVGVHEMGNLPRGMEDVAGILSLGFFDRVPFTIDYPRGEVRIGVDPRGSGVPVPIRLIREGPSVSAYLRMLIPGDRTVEVEVDSGTDVLILHSKLMAGLGVDPQAPSTQRREGTDETGFRYTRYFSTLHGQVRLEGAPEISQSDPRAMFQEIIYDGLIGDEFLRQFAVTFDLERSTLVFQRTIG